MACSRRKFQAEGKQGKKEGIEGAENLWMTFGRIAEGTKVAGV